MKKSEVNVNLIGKKAYFIWEDEVAGTPNTKCGYCDGDCFFVRLDNSEIECVQCKGTGLVCEEGKKFVPFWVV